MNASWPETASLQRRYAAALSDAAMVDELLSACVGEAGLVRDRLAIYRGNVRANWLKALLGAYPVVAQLVGEEFFEGLAREFGRSYPSASGDLNEFGGQLAEFVESFPHTRNLAYLPDVARLEWCVHRAYYAADQARLDLHRLGSVPEERYGGMQFVIAPAVSTLASRWPLERIWTVHQKGYAGDPEVDLDAGPGWVLVHRPEFAVEVKALSQAEFAFLRACAAGQPLEQALSLASGQDASFDLAATLTQWVNLGVIVGFNLYLETV